MAGTRARDADLVHEAGDPVADVCGAEALAVAVQERGADACVGADGTVAILTIAYGMPV